MDRKGGFRPEAAGSLKLFEMLALYLLGRRNDLQAGSSPLPLLSVVFRLPAVFREVAVRFVLPDVPSGTSTMMMAFRGLWRPLGRAILPVS